MFCTGFPDRAPVRCTEPSGYAHTGGEAAFAALTGLASGRPQVIDVSMQEVVFTANMCNPASFPKTHFRGKRLGANIGRTREIWPTTDGFVSFGLRGGKARIPSLETITRVIGEAGIDASALEAQNWADWSPNHAPDDVLRAVEAPIAEYFATRTMQELYDLACETNLMLAPANSPARSLPAPNSPPATSSPPSATSSSSLSPSPKSAPPTTTSTLSVPAAPLPLASPETPTHPAALGHSSSRLRLARRRRPRRPPTTHRTPGGGGGRSGPPTTLVRRRLGPA